MDWLDRLARSFMTRARTRIFPDGWGDLPAASSSVHPIDIEWLDTRGSSSLEVLDGTFPSPAPLPRSAATGHVRWYRPRKARGVCVLLAASNEEGYGRRSALARRLAVEGIGSLLLENPYYGARRVHESSPPVRTVGELLTMGSAAVQEARGLLLGFGDLMPGVSGYSMGGNIAALVAATHPDPVVAIPLAPSPSPAAVFTEGILSTFVNWSSLACSRSELADVLDRVSVLALPPPVRPDLAIIVGARGDGYIPASAVESIHRHWAGSELRWEPGGHLSLATIGRQRLVRAIVDGFNRAV
ncbi:MAG: alpha/beta hydrolase family protein [Acidimicrobiia bacterium]